MKLKAECKQGLKASGTKYQQKYFRLGYFKLNNFIYAVLGCVQI